VVAFDCAAAGELVRHGHNGLLAKPGADADFCSTAARLAGQTAEARALGTDARQTALKLDWGRIAREVESAYQGAMALAPFGRSAALAPEGA
jgi:glycosyltransferase involved in cell wall biosynthesis